MNNLKMYCISLDPSHLNLIQKIGYTPVGLGINNFSNSWQTDKIGINISNKNPFYGEYTFHYNIWKNNLIDFKGWFGFCQYRKFWVKKKPNADLDFNYFNSMLLKNINTQDDTTFDVILGEEMHINQFRFSKFIKRNLKKMILQPSLFYNKKKRNIKFHFDMWHGNNNLDKAIDLLDKKEKEDFRNFVNSEVSFNPHNMFICKNKTILFKYYESVFPWLERCEKIFGFKNLSNYGLKRIYGFLAERYMSYWFKKYTTYKTYPILFKDLSDFL